MRNKLFSLSLAFLASFIFTSADIAAEIPVLKEKITENSSEKESYELSIEEKINGLYETFSLNNKSMPSLISFQNGMLGYYKLLKEGKIKNQVLTIVDFSLPSSEKRMWILDMVTHNVLFNTYVAHGQKTGLDMAKNFSNKPDSHQSSLGFYLTAETYIGKHGLSMRMDGLEKGFNNNARDRFIVVHGADYATSAFVQRVGRLGRSYGCPAVPTKLSKEIIQTIKEQSCFFIYYPSEKYLQNSKYLEFKTV